MSETLEGFNPIKKINKSEFAKAHNAFGNIPMRSYAYDLVGRESVNSGDNTYIRSNYNRADWEYYRSSDKIPQKTEDSIKLCDKVYHDVSIVRSVIDMMADFTVQGIQIEHRDPSIQNFLDDWMNFVDFNHVTERIANTLYRIANSPVKIGYGKVPIIVERDWKKSSADEVVINNNDSIYRRIPLKYNILNPSNLEIVGGELSSFIGKPIYGLKPSPQLMEDIRRLHREKKKLSVEEKELLKLIPSEMVEKIVSGQNIIPINPENLEMLFYKKDDWRTWSVPMVHAILKPIFRLNKMHLADEKALDGAISQIRLWSLGSFEHGIYPLAASINKLRSVLSKVGSGDVMDIVWGPELTFKESESKSYNFLKSEKYSQVMTEIYAGLGVPPSLTGSETSTSFSNNSVSMRTLVERLEYGRRIIKRFWEGEMKKIQKAFNWKYPPIVTFNFKVLGDEQAEKKILLDLWDRNLISDEKVVELCGHHPALERVRISKDYRKIKSGKIPPKSSPYHNPNINDDLKKIILQNGGVAPSEVGLDLKEKKEGEKSIKELDAEQAQKIQDKIGKQSNLESKNKGTPGEGRPIGTKDKEQRTRKEKPRKAVGFINLFNWANDIQDQINTVMTPFILDHYSKANLRGLNKEQVKKV